ncbi:hypothetical protein P3T18_003353 [Paraburkholderia sp. GAS199]
MTSAIWGIVGGVTALVAASFYLRQYRFTRRPDPRWSGKKR